MRAPEDLHRIGLLSLYRGKTARAVAELEVAAEAEPSAAVLSDLAAAYLALAEPDKPGLTADAVVAASRAVDRAPEQTFAAFNFALALETLQLTHESSLAWESYLRLENDREWRREASDHLVGLRKPTTIDRWEKEKRRVTLAADAMDRGALTSMAQQFPRQIKELLETDLFAAWAHAIGTPPEQARLQAAQIVAEVLARDGERIYVDAIAAINDSTKTREILAEGHRAYARGLALTADCSRAVPELELAFSRFSAAKSPMSLAARYQELVCTYRRRPADAERPLQDLAASLEGRSYPTLLARTQAMRGLCSMSQGSYSQAIMYYEAGLKLVKQSADTDALNLMGMLDEAYRFLGDRDRAWKYRLESLGGAVAAGNRRIRHAVLAGLARDLIATDRREAAVIVLDEMLANAKAWRQPGAVAETLLRRIQLRLRTGKGSDERVAADIAECGEFLKQYRQPAARERLETELLISMAEEQLFTDPTQALATIRSVMSRLQASGDGLHLPRALLDLARASVAAGETAAAAQALEQGLHILEERRRNTVGEDVRISFFATVQESFDAMVRFQALTRRDPRAAFLYAERSRARALGDRLIGDQPPRPLALAEQLARIPENVAILAYTQLPERLIVWRLHRGRLRMHVVPASRSHVAKVAASLRAALSGGGPVEHGRRAAARAFDLLLAPVLQGLPPESELIFLLDRELNQVPFAALFDVSRDRYVFQDYSCLVAPSLEVYLSSLDRGSSHRRFRSVLAVGDPAFDAKMFPALRHLRYAREEAIAVASMYENGRVLLRERATQQRILRELRGHQVLHFAAHVVVDPRDPLASFLPTAGRDRIRAADLDEKRLSGVSLVVLSACDTAPGFADGDREGVAGLARAFLASGVSSVLATLWAVDDEAAAQLATRFHHRLQRGDSAARALRLSQVELLSDSRRAPFAWAAFQLYRGI